MAAIKDYAKKITVHPSFIIAFIFFLVFGYIKIFFVLMLFVTLHEMTHVIVALKYGCSLQRISFFVFGESAELLKMEYLTQSKRIKILLSGPFLNIILGTVFLLIQNMFSINNENLQFIITANFVLGFFNLLPVCPVDGGKTLHILLGNNQGIINSSVLMSKMAAVAGALFILAGTVQVILFPINISLLCVGLFILFESKKCMIQYQAELLRYAFSKKDKLITVNAFKTKTLTVSSNLTLIDIMKWITWDHFSVFYIYENGSIEGSITETEIMLLAEALGGGCRISEIYSSSNS